MERDGVTEREAAAVLRRAARAAEVTVRQHSTDVVASTRPGAAAAEPSGPDG